MHNQKQIQSIPVASQQQEPLQIYQNDTIDLVDIFVKLIQRKRIILASLLICFLAGLAYAMLKSPTFSYTTAVEIGSQMNSNGTQVFFENAATVKSKLETAYIPQVLQSYIAANSDTERLKNLEISVSIPKNSELVVLSAKGAESLSVKILEIEQLILDSLVNDHSRILKVIRSSIIREKAEAEAELAHLQNEKILDVSKKKLEADLVTAQTNYQRVNEPEFIKIKRKAVENKLKAVESKLSVLAENSKKLQTDADNLERAKQKMTEKVEDIQRQIQLSMNRRQQAIENVDDPTQAMTVLMIDNEIQQSRQFLSKLEERLYIELAEKISNLQADKKENQHEQNVIKAKISKIKLDLLNFDKEVGMEQAPAKADIAKIRAELSGLDVDRERDIEKQLQTIQDLNIKIDNLSPTRSVSKPMQSLNPQGMSKIKTVAIFIFLGFVIGIVLVVFFEMNDKARIRLRELEAKS